uniref:Elicitin n=1 Tax=Albugo laibachii Nc14 TaxID=890382 RepID=F0X2V9_9STRA|nr:AlNc14C2006G13124 [Albugo laibachii Nc14]|eukprot:CCA28288.1 AlNc14C2006G13124 [Albugo laibachii Nc14]
MGDSSNTMNTPSGKMMTPMANNSMNPEANNDMQTTSTDAMKATTPMCSPTVTTMGINKLTNGTLLSACFTGMPMSVNNVSDAAKLPSASLQKICSSSECMKPFMEMASSAVYKSCVVMYDGKMQNLAEQAQTFVNVCKKSDDDDSNSGSTDGSSDAGTKDSTTDPTIKDEKSSAVFHSFSAACIAVSFLLAMQ